MQPEYSDSVHGVDDDQLAAIVNDLPTLPNIRAEDADRFSQAIRALVETRAQDGWTNEGKQDVAVFVMVNRPRQVGEKHGAKPFADPIANNAPLLGNLFLTNRDASAGRVMPMPVTDVNEILDWLEDNGLTDQPLVTIYRGSKKMVTRRRGIGNLAHNDPIREHPPSASLDELLKALNFFHLNSLLTPTCCLPDVWEKGRENEYVPSRRPEKCIQRGLVLALNYWFHGVVRADHEDTTNIGRIDVRLLIKSDQGHPLTYWAIIELKVIKSFVNAKIGCDPNRVNDSVNINLLIEGIRQAWAYQQNRETDIGLLEVFDLRKDKRTNLIRDDKVIAGTTQYTPTPKQHVRPIFGKARDARIAGFTG